MIYVWTFVAAMIGGLSGSLVNYGIKAYLERRKKTAFIKILEQRIREDRDLGRGAMPILLDPQLLQRCPQGEQLDSDPGPGSVEQQ